MQQELEVDYKTIKDVALIDYGMILIPFLSLSHVTSHQCRSQLGNHKNGSISQSNGCSTFIIHKH